MKQIEFKGKIYYYLCSEQILIERKTLLIFHGIASNAEMMSDEIKHFEKQYNVIAPTLDHVTSFYQWSSVVNSIFEKEGIKRVFVKGGSFGGIVAQGYYHYNSLRIDGLVLVNTLPPQPGQGKDDKKLIWMLKIFPVKFFKTLMLKKLDGVFEIDKIPKEKVAEVNGVKSKMREILSSKISKSHLRATFNLLNEFDNEGKYNIELPEYVRKLFITSNTDPSYSHLETIRKLFKDIVVKEFDEVGHLLPILKKKEYYELLNDFLQN